MCTTVRVKNVSVGKWNKKDGYRHRKCVSFCNQPKAHFSLPWVRRWDNRGKCHMDEKSIQYLSNASQHVPIYLQPFTSYSEILVGNCNLFLPPCI